MTSKQKQWAILKSKLQAIADNPAPKGYKYDPDLKQMVPLAQSNIKTGKVVIEPFQGKWQDGKNRARTSKIVIDDFVRDDTDNVTHIYYRHPQAVRANPSEYSIPKHNVNTVTHLVDSGEISEGLIYKAVWNKANNRLMNLKLEDGQHV